MMKNLKTIASIFTITTLLFTGCTSTQTSKPSNSTEDGYKKEVINEQKEVSDESKETDSQQKIEEIQSNKSPVQETIKYYVDKNYFIKPVNPDDSKKVVLLTFDDAPRGEFTSDILATLDKHQAKAIFFVNGHYAIKNKELLKEIYDKGHIIGNHTWWHEYLPNLNEEKTKKEIIDVNNLVEEVTGERPQYFRPPNGKMTSSAEEIVKNEKMQRMNWSVGSLDWEYNKPEQSNEVVNQVLNTMVPGANILMHDKEVTSKALDEILTKLEEQGYTFILPTEVILPEK